jgi:hypothetical protein
MHVAVQRQAVGGLLDEIALPAPVLRLAHRVELPHALAGFRVEGSEEADSAVFSGDADDGRKLPGPARHVEVQAVADAIDADDHLAVDHQRGGGCADAGTAADLALDAFAAFRRGSVGTCQFDVPVRLAAGRIKRDQSRIDRGDEHAAVVESHAPVRRAAAHLFRALPVRVAPQLGAGTCVERHHMRAGQRHVHPSAHHQRCGLEGLRDAALIDPSGYQLSDGFRRQARDVRQARIGMVEAESGPVTVGRLGG